MRYGKIEFINNFMEKKQQQKYKSGKEKPMEAMHIHSQNTSLTEVRMP
jgi:hypothetical protein